MHYREQSVEGIGVWRPKLAEFGEERGVELLNESGLRVTSLSWAGGFTGTNGFSFEEAIDDAADAIQTAEQIQAECVVLVSGSRSGHTANHARRIVVEALKRLGDVAGEAGVFLAIQPMHNMFANEWTFLTSLDDTLDILDRCQHPQLKMAFDVYSLWQEPELLSRIPELTPHLATVRISDWQEPRSDSDRYLPGDGLIPLQPIMNAMVNAGYGGCFEIEIWSEHHWASNYFQLVSDCCERFRSLLDR